MVLKVEVAYVEGDVAKKWVWVGVTHTHQPYDNVSVFLNRWYFDGLYATNVTISYDISKHTMDHFDFTSSDDGIFITLMYDHYTEELEDDATF
ncbi:hypothetical protein LXL04_023926 [Taraxacum kok-saghyz]